MTATEQDKARLDLMRRLFKSNGTVECPNCGHPMKSVLITRSGKTYKDKKMRVRVPVGFLCFACKTFKPSEHFYKEREIYGASDSVVSNPRED